MITFMLMMLDLMKGYELDLLMKRQNLGGENVYQSPPSKLPHRLALLVSWKNYNNFGLQISIGILT